ncbi:MAG TPA: T9SS type A sorting domain-containing protein [Candidatus Cloacimonadota bacterium]|nr:T9SS type A sorting domain-containing protein [Candidatus Cloacimonadota bacterium]
MPDSYCETIDLSPLADVNIPSLTIIGWGDGVIINRQVDATCYPCIIMTGNQGENIFIDNLTINHASVGVLFDLSEANRITISNCTFNNCSIDTGTNAAIVSNVPTTISNCTISDIHKGCISLENHTNRPSIINGCNLAHKLNAISITGTGHFDITNNSFNASMPFVPNPDGYIMLVSNVGSANIAHNILFMPEEQLAANCINVTGSGLDSKQITINNNTYNYMTECVNICANSNVKLENNIFANSQIGIKDNYPYNTVSSSYNLFENVDTPLIEDEGNPASHPGCIYTTEEVIDSNYQPVWNSMYMSPCVDAGTGENDPDGTPPDIGAFRAAEHGYWSYCFRSGNTTPSNRGEPYHWVSYPVVNSLTQGKAKAETFFAELLGTHQNSNDDVLADVLHEILWNEGGNSKRIYWTGSGWGQFYDNHNVSSPQGYKIKLLPVDPNATAPTTVELHHSGFKTPENTPFHLGGTITNGYPDYENWIGYFGEKSAWPDEALASIWNDITKIQAKDWCLYRDPNSGVSGLQGKMLTLNPGDMVIVKTQYDHEFQWNDATPVDPKTKEKPLAFIYEEKPDYTPVYLDLAAIDLNDLKEIGLLLDGTCKGAVVVRDTLEQISAFLDDGESLSSGVVELVFYYENKSQPQEMKRVSLNASSLKANHIDGNDNYPVYNITILPEDMVNVVVPVLALDQNYPNPFNPSTNIRYSLDKSGPVSLDIYNIKGQLVKNLCTEAQDKGPHTIVWNGTDNKGSACSSGVYFYRLRTSDKTLVRKMLMLK